MASKLKFYRFAKSGHSHRVELMLNLVGVPFEPVDIDLASGAHKKPDFLEISPFGLVPAIDDDGFRLADSNAILVYLTQTYAKGSGWLPEDPKDAAEVQRWLTIAAHNIFAGPCSARLVTLFGAPLDHKQAIQKAHDLFNVMEAHLSGRNWLVTERATIADVAGYSYIAHAPEGGVDLAAYPNIRAWIARIETLPNFVGMPKSPVPELA